MVIEKDTYIELEPGNGFYSHKTRVCTDLSHGVNAYLHRCPFRMPTVSDLADQLTEGAFMQKMDQKAGYTHFAMALDHALR